jgi:hypothetical protein
MKHLIMKILFSCLFVSPLILSRNFCPFKISVKRIHFPVLYDVTCIILSSLKSVGQIYMVLHTSCLASFLFTRFRPIHYKKKSTVKSAEQYSNGSTRCRYAVVGIYDG